MKTYALDTNVLIHDPRALFSFEENYVVIAEYVILELDKLKEGNEERNHNAREASRLLRQISQGLSQSLIEQQKGRQPELKLKMLPELSIPGTAGKLIILMDDPDHRVQGETRDDQILGLIHKNREQLHSPIIVVTKDTLMSIKAIARGFGHQDFKRDQAKAEIKHIPALDPSLFPIDELFASDKPISVPGILSKTYAEADKTFKITVGYYIMAFQNEKQTLIHIDGDETVRVINHTPSLCKSKTSAGIRAQNLEQHAAIDALMNERKTLVCMLGPAGTGKTLLAIASALDAVKKANRFLQPPEPVNTKPNNTDDLTRKERKQITTQRKQPATVPVNRMQLLIARPMITMGKEMGFLPGDIEEKMRPWIQPIVDNLKLLLGEDQVEALLEDGTIELQPLQFIRGRSISNAVLIIDESQNTSPLEIKTIITRAGRNCRIILTGDPAQIDVPYLDRLSNGLTYAADRLKAENFAAIIPLTKCERSHMAARAAELL